MNFLIKTLGCRVNRAESREISEKLKAKGWQEVGPARLVILNSCCVTQKAEKETRQMARKLRRDYPRAYLIIAGCVVDYWQCQGKDRQMAKELGVDQLLTNQEKERLTCHLDFF